MEKKKELNLKTKRKKERAFPTKPLHQGYSFSTEARFVPATILAVPPVLLEGPLAAAGEGRAGHVIRYTQKLQLDDVPNK